MTGFELNKTFFSLFIVTGFVVGIAAASQIWPRPSRAERIMSLFSQYCLLPYSEDLTKKLRQNLNEWTPVPGAETWVDSRSASLLLVNTTRCSISTNAPFALTHDEASELRELVNAFVPKQFPELKFDPKSKLGDAELSTAWMAGAVATAERWGIYSFAYPDWGESAGSILSYARPPLRR